MNAQTEHGFIFAGQNIDGKYRPVTRYQCTRCPTTIDMPYKSGDALNPEAVQTYARKRGWTADAYHASVTLCPACTRDKGEKGNDPDSELKKLQAKLDRNKSMTLTAIPLNHVPKPKPPRTADITVTMVARSPAADKRARIRELIEEHFDEDLGYYLDEYSDERIATEIDVPRIHVEQAREFAYGPIKVSAEVVALRKEVADIRVKLSTQLSEVEALMETVRADITATHKQLAGVEEKLSRLKE